MTSIRFSALPVCLYNSSGRFVGQLNDAGLVTGDEELRVLWELVGDEPFGEHWFLVEAQQRGYAVEDNGEPDGGGREDTGEDAE